MTPKLSNNHCQTDDVIFLAKKRHFWCQKNVKSYQTVTAKLFLDFRFGYKMETNEIKFKFSFQECPKFLSAAIGQRPRNYSRCCCCLISSLKEIEVKKILFVLESNRCHLELYSSTISTALQNQCFTFNGKLSI